MTKRTAMFLYTSEGHYCIVCGWFIEEGSIALIVQIETSVDGITHKHICEGCAEIIAHATLE